MTATIPTGSLPDWRDSLPLLDGLPLLPCGAGDKGKAPLDPATGGLLTGWQQAAYSPEQIKEMNGVVLCCGTRCGPDAGGLLVLDLDGASAIEAVRQVGYDPSTSTTWKINRTTAPDRLKLAFRVPTECWPLFIKGKAKRITKSAKVEPITEKDEQLEAFWSSGQVILLGLHKETGGQYEWAGLPADAAPLAPGHILWPLVLDLLGDAKPAPATPTIPPAAANHPGLASGVAADDLTRARDALRFLCPDGYDEWIKYGICLHDIDPTAGLAVWDEWSRGSTKYKGLRDLEAHWKTFKAGGYGGGALFKAARTAGWVDPYRTSGKQEPPPGCFGPEPEPPTSNGSGHQQAWEPPAAAVDAEEQAAQAAATEDLLAAGREPITLADVLPAGLAGPLTERAAAFPCDPMAFLLPLLCAIASVVGDRMVVKVKETWKEPFVLWGATVMPASSLKSPIAGVIQSALAKWQADIAKQHKAEKKLWGDDRNRVALAADAAALKEWEAENPPPPPGRQLFIVDATLEKIGQFLGQGNTPGMVAFHDELSLWFQQLKRGKDAMDQQGNWLSMWTGGLLKVDRIGRESVYVPRTAQSVYGLATVAGLANIRQSKRGNSEHGDADGLWARFLIWQPDDVPFRFNRLDRCVKDLLLDLFRSRIDAKLPAPEEAPEQPSFLALSDEAVAFMEPHWNAWDDEARQTTEERGQWIGKLRGQSVRLAGLLQVLDRASKDLPLLDDISEEMGRRAIRLSYALLNQYDLLCPKVGGDTGDLDPAVAKLLVLGMGWRRAHGAAPVPSEKLRNWGLPSRVATAKERRDWLCSVLPPDGSRGVLHMTAKSFEWVPPK